MSDKIQNQNTSSVQQINSGTTAKSSAGTAKSIDANIDNLNRSFSSQLNSKIDQRLAEERNWLHGKGMAWVGLTLNIGWSLSIPVLLAVVVNKFLLRFESYRAEPMYICSVLFLGFFCGIYNVYRELRTLIRRNDKEAKDLTLAELPTKKKA